MKHARQANIPTVVDGVLVEVFAPCFLYLKLLLYFNLIYINVTCRMAFFL
jgi:hypothetical protein